MPIAKGELSRTVPSGYDLIVRQVIFIPGEALVNVDAFGAVPLEWLMTLQSNNAGIVQNTDIPIFLLGGENVIDVFFTAPENAEVKVLLSLESDVYTLVGEGMNVAINIYGNLILSDNRPDNMVVSTKVG